MGSGSWPGTCSYRALQVKSAQLKTEPWILSRPCWALWAPSVARNQGRGVIPPLCWADFHL